MALTAAPVPGNTILAAWGTEIRNRAVQVFATAAEADAWNAPQGALCYRTDVRCFFFRYSTVWRPVTPGDAFSGTANASGDYAIAHNLGFTPRSATVTPAGGNINFVIAQIMSITNASIVVRCRNQGGTALANQLVSGYWMAVTTL